MSRARPELRRRDPAEERVTTERCSILETRSPADDPDQAVARARVEPRLTTRWRRLQGIAERYLIVSGEGAAEIQGWRRPPSAPATSSTSPRAGPSAYVTPELWT